MSVTKFKQGGNVKYLNVVPPRPRDANDTPKFNNERLCTHDDLIAQRQKMN